VLMLMVGEQLWLEAEPDALEVELVALL